MSLSNWTTVSKFIEDHKNLYPNCVITDNGDCIEMLPKTLKNMSALISIDFKNLTDFYIRLEYPYRPERDFSYTSKVFLADIDRFCDHLRNYIINGDIS